MVAERQQQQQQLQQQVLNNRPGATNTMDQLRRNILDSAYQSQKGAQVAQEELERQGKQLRTSLVKAEIVAKRTDTTAQIVDDLIAETRAGRLRKLFRCCLDTCCCFSCNAKKNLVQGGPTLGHSKLPQANSPSAASDKEEDCDSQALVILDSLKSETATTTEGRAKNSWKRTLAPQPGDAALYGGTTEIWYRQVDASLTQLQHVAEDMGQSLDEQIRLAQMLTIYLNYGVDQVIGANERLGKAGQQ